MQSFPTIRQLQARKDAAGKCTSQAGDCEYGIQPHLIEGIDSFRGFEVK
jgi:hypothetical protein